MNTTKPALQQSTPSSKPYRLFTAEHVAFDQFPPYSQGGPAKVVIDGYSVSYSSQSSMFGATVTDRLVTLSIFRIESRTPYVVVKHDLDGTKYPTQREAEQAAFEAGALAFMVYES